MKYVAYVVNLKLATALATALVLPSSGPAQIGGQTSASGPFVIDDVEDLNIQSESLSRTWLFSVLVNTPTDFQLTGSGLTTAPGQTPVGAFNLTFTDDNAFIIGEPNSVFGNLGIPLPGVPGASTDPNAGGTPGNVTSFEELTFFECYDIFGDTVDTVVQGNVLIECYPQNPDNSFPTLQYDFEPSLGTTFQPVQLDLSSPLSIRDNPSNLTVKQLLSQTRFMNIFYIASPVGEPTFMDVHVDDITFTGVAASADHWHLYR